MLKDEEISKEQILSNLKQYKELKEFEIGHAEKMIDCYSISFKNKRYLAMCSMYISMIIIEVVLTIYNFTKSNYPLTGLYFFFIILFSCLLVQYVKIIKRNMESVKGLERDITKLKYDIQLIDEIIEEEMEELQDDKR